MNGRILFFIILLTSLMAPICAPTKDAMVFPGATWQTATPESQGVDPVVLREALDFLHAHSNGAGTDETVIIRNGYQIWKGPEADRVHELYSCTKTFTSTVLGLLEKDGILHADDFAVKYLPTLDDTYPNYAKMKLSHLASMTSGYDNLNGSGWEFYRTDRAKHHEHVLTYTTPGPPLFPAGTSFQYHDPAVHLLGYILTKVSGKSLEELFKKRVADPIGMKEFRWSDYGLRDGMKFNNPAGTPGENQGGIYTNALDAARYGLLYLNEGRWNGETILEPSFVQRAVSNQVPAETQTKYFDLTGRYGFFWWTNGIRADGTRPLPSAPPKTYTAHGAGRNFIYIIPEWRMVIVRLSPAPGGHTQIGSMKEAIWEEFFSHLKNGIQ